MLKLTKGLQALLCGTLAALTCSAIAWACECRIPNICEKVDRASVIFLGEVYEEGVVKGGRAPEEYASEFAKLRVIEIFRGLRPETKDVTVSLFLVPQCGYRSYKRGEQTLVFLYPRDKGELHDGSCPMSVFAKQAPEQLEYVRRYFRGQTTTTIKGRIAATPQYDAVDTLIDHGLAKPVPGIQVMAEAFGKKLSTVTDEQGRYEFSGIQAGTYRVSAARDGFRTQGPFQPVTVSSKGCAVFNMGVLPDKQGR